MKGIVCRTRPALASLALLVTALPLPADDRVILIATASEEYGRRRLDASGQPRVETYVLMEGKVHDGIIADGSVQKTSFLQIAGFLAPELAKQHYLPTRDVAAADLLLVVTRGTTIPRVTSDQMRGIVSIDPSGGENEKIEQFKKSAMLAQAGPGLGVLLAGPPPRIGEEFMSEETRAQLRHGELDRITDQQGNASRTDTNASLLGYHQQLNRMKKKTISSPQETALRLDLETERYFLIIRAYDLKKKPAAKDEREPVWVLHVNMSTSGQSFTTAVNQMSAAARDYFGRNTDGFQTLQPAKGKVRLAPLVIEGEPRSAAAKPADTSKSP